MKAELPNTETTWGAELTPLLIEIERYMSVNKLMMQPLAAEGVEVLLQTERMKPTDYAFLVGDQQTRPLTSDQMLAFIEYFKEVEFPGVSVSTTRTNDEYGILIINKVIH